MQAPRAAARSFSFEGLEASAAADHQAARIYGPVCRLPAAVQVASRAETETTRVLRASGRAGSAPRRLLLVFSTTKPNLSAATSDEVKILMTNATQLSSREVIELYALRWQIELFFKELKSTLGFHQYRFQSFAAVQAWAEIAITTVLFLEQLRARALRDRRLTKERRASWAAQRVHGLCAAFRQECAAKELCYFRTRLKTPGGIAKLQRLLHAAIPQNSAPQTRRR
jgi:hypothetical protein